MSKNEQVKAVIKRILADQKEHSMEEIRVECDREKIGFETYKNAIRNVIYLMKKAGEIKDGSARGTYRLATEKEGTKEMAEKPQKEEKQEKEDVGSQIDIDWSKYFVLKPQGARYTERRITIIEKGEMRLNATFQKDIAKKKNRIDF